MTERITLATALRRRKNLRGKLAALDARLVAANLYEEKNPPAFAFSVTLEERKATVEQLLKLDVAIDIANTKSLPNGGPVAALAIRQLAEMKSEIALISKLPSQPRDTRVEVTESRDWDHNVNPPRVVSVKKETVFKCEMPVPKQAEVIDRLKAQFEKLNAQLEAFNHETFIEV